MLAFVAAANAGIATYGGGAVIAPTVTSQQQNILRSYGNLGQVSTYSKTIDTPYSSVSKSDVRVSNPGLVSHTPAVAYHHQPAVHTYSHAAPVAYHQPAIHAAPVAYHSPVHTAHVASPAVVKTGLLGVAYSPATSVSHMTYSNGLGLTYSW